MESAELRDLHVELVACYCQPHRHYHTKQHLSECFQSLAEIAALAPHLGEVEIAIWFHDAIYDTHRSDNEQLSAEWARRAAASFGVASEGVERIGDLILFTRHAAEPVGQDAQVLADVDLGILGAAPARFDEYEDQVRKEYAWVPDAVFRATRAEILRGFLARPQIYTTPPFQEHREAQARTNLSRSLERLEAP